MLRALNSFSFVWGSTDFTTCKSLRLHTHTLQFSSALQLLLLLISFGFIQIQPSHSKSHTAFRLSFTALRAHALFVSSRRSAALRYDLAVSCFLLTVLRHTEIRCSTTLCRFFSPSRGIQPTDTLFALHLSSTLACFFGFLLLLLYLNSNRSTLGCRARH